MARVERPRWRVNEQSVVGHALVQQNDEVYYTPPEDGEVAANLSPLNDAAQEIVEAQKSDHPDKAVNAAKRRKRLAVTEEEEQVQAQEKGDGPVPKSQTKGDTKSEPKPKAAKKPDAAPDDGDDGDVG